MKKKKLVVILSVLTIITIGVYAIYKTNNLSSNKVSTTKQLTETKTSAIPEIKEVLDVYFTSSYPSDFGKEPHRLYPNDLKQKEVISGLLQVLNNAKRLPDKQPKGYPIRRNWSLIIEYKNGTSVVIHGNYSTKSVEQRDSNDNVTASGTEYSPLPDEYLVKYAGDDSDTKIYSPELTEFIKQNNPNT